MMIFDKEVPQQWLDALAVVQAACPEAVLAGGSLRDLILGGAVKDLDIFIADTANAFSVSASAQAYGWKRSRIIPSFIASYTGLAQRGVVAIEYYVMPDGQEVNVITLEDLDTPYDVITRMDFGACQIGVVGQDQCIITEAAFKDIANRRITMLIPLNENEQKHSLSRAERFRVKYAGTDVVVDTSIAASGFTLEERLERMFA